MAENKKGNARLRASYITSIISIMLVLFMLGLLGLIIMHGRKLSQNIRENISISIMLRENIASEQLANLQKRLNLYSYVKSAEFVSREKAAKELSSELGEDFVQFLGYNPLPASIDIKLLAPYANADSIAKIEKKLNAEPIVKEVVYPRLLINEVNTNIRKISLLILGFSILLLVISIILINNTIRLSVYSRRFLIRSMQLVGATEGFIRRPFVKRSVLHGIIAGVLAVLLLAGLIWLTRMQMPELSILQDYKEIGVFFVGILLAGIILSAISTRLSVNKFLRMHFEQLYTH